MEQHETGSNASRPLLLEVTHLDMTFGGLKAVVDFNLAIHPGELVGLIGPNGAGKTTVFNCITNVYKPTSGSIKLDGVEISRFTTHDSVKYGVARTFQNIRLFKRLTVLENVKVAFNTHMSYGYLAALFRTKKYWREEHAIDAEARQILGVLGLSEYLDDLAMNLPYGKQRKLEIARALATHPKLLCLDEPAAGMNPTETEELMETIKIIRETFGVTILLIEHDMKLVMGICDWITVLNFGQVIAVGTPKEIANDPEVIKAYLGG